jgi:hypothetical protein
VIIYIYIYAGYIFPCIFTANKIKVAYEFQCVFVKRPLRSFRGKFYQQTSMLYKTPHIPWGLNVLIIFA